MSANEEENNEFESTINNYNLAPQEFDENIEQVEEEKNENKEEIANEENKDEEKEKRLENNLSEQSVEINSKKKEEKIEEKTEQTNEISEEKSEEKMDQVDNSSEKISGENKEETEKKEEETPKQNIDFQLSGTLASKHDDDERKIFVGGLHWETTMVDLFNYFQKFGEVVDCTLKTDPSTGRSRGFGFVLFNDVSSVDRVCIEKVHNLQGKIIDPKRAVSKTNNSTGNGSTGKEPVKKIFVGGVSPETPEQEIRDWFSKYGKIEEVELPFDRVRNQRRAYVFITFQDEKMADQACQLSKQKMGEREVDVKRATPRSENEANKNSSRGRGPYDYNSYYGYGYPSYQMSSYDYSGYYSNEWIQYGQYPYGYNGGVHVAPGGQPVPPSTSGSAPPSSVSTPYNYDYAAWYAQQDPAGKTKRNAVTPNYHPYNR